VLRTALADRSGNAVSATLSGVSPVTVRRAHTEGGKETPVASWTPGGQASQASNLAAATTIPASEIRSVDIRVTGTTTPLAVTTLG
jgi:hypothetical protein